MRGADTLKPLVPLGQSDRQIAEAKEKATPTKPVDRIEQLKAGVIIRNGRYETVEPKK